jgi:hypothetical protein
MLEELTTTSVKALLKFPFRDRDWLTRFLVGSLLVLAGFFIPIAPWIFVQGYYIRVMRRASKGEELTLPAWDDWGGLANDGARALLVRIVYMLPGMLVYLGGMLIYFIASFGFPILLPFLIMLTGGEESSAGPVVLLFLFVMLAAMLIFFISMLLGMVLMFLGMIPLPMALAHFSFQDKLSAAFRVRGWWPLLKANKLGFLVAWVIVLGLGFVVAFPLVLVYYTIILALFAYILAAPVGFYLQIVDAAVFGRTYRESVALAEAGDKS